MTAKSRIVILVLAVVGLAFAGASTWIHYKLMTDVSYVSICDVSSKLNCSQVYLSSYGSIWGVPVAIGGMFWFALVAAIAWFGRVGRGEATGSYIFLLSIIGMASILYLGHASYTMGVACLLCIGTYVSVFGIFLVAGASPSIPILQVPARMFSDLFGALRKPEVSVVALVIAAGTVATAAFFPKEGQRSLAAAAPQTAAEQLTFEQAWDRQPRIDLGIPADGAKVVIVKFNDYQCPMCRITHEEYKPVLEKYEQSNPGAVKYVLKDWPFNTKCNNAGPTLHVGACEAAVAARIARTQGKEKAREMEDWLFAHQLPAATPQEVKDAAQKILGIKDFDQQYQKYLPEIRKDIADGRALSVGGTPTFFINGVRLNQQMPAPYLDLIIQIEMKKATGAGK